MKNITISLERYNELMNLEKNFNTEVKKQADKEFKFQRIIATITISIMTLLFGFFLGIVAGA